MTFAIFDEQVGSVGDTICAVQSDNVEAVKALAENVVSSGSLLKTLNRECVCHIHRLINSKYK